MISLMLFAVTAFAPQKFHVPMRHVPAAAIQMTAVDDEAELLRLCALTDRGQRAAPGAMEQLRNVVARLEMNAPPADATDLNGDWLLLAACGESAYRSSPFFWAFRQATASYTTPSEYPAFFVICGFERMKSTAERVLSPMRPNLPNTVVQSVD